MISVIADGDVSIGIEHVARVPGAGRLQDIEQLPDLEALPQHRTAPLRAHEYAPKTTRSNRACRSDPHRVAVLEVTLDTSLGRAPLFMVRSRLTSRRR